MESNIKALLLMRDTGGSFSSALAEAWLKADSDNQRRLMKAFQDLHDEFVRRLELTNK